MCFLQTKQNQRTNCALLITLQSNKKKWLMTVAREVAWHDGPAVYLIAGVGRG